MTFPVAFNAESEHKRGQDENDDSFFLRRKDKPIAQGFKLRAPDSFQFNSATKRRRHFRAGRRRELECRCWNRPIRLIRIGRDNTVAVWLQHFRASYEQLIAHAQIEFSEHPLHRGRSRN